MRTLLAYSFARRNIVFSIPSGLKNILEWSVSTTIFSDKPVGILTASARGEKGHEELVLIIKTLMAKLTPDTTLLIKGIKGKINQEGAITDVTTQSELLKFIHSFQDIVL